MINFNILFYRILDFLFYVQYTQCEIYIGLQTQQEHELTHWCYFLKKKNQ